MDFIAVTGTNGKTTCTYWIRHLLGGKKVGVIGTLCAFVGDKEIAYTAPKLTTPDARQLDEIIAKMRDMGVETVVMEASAHGIAQKRLYTVARKSDGVDGENGADGAWSVGSPLPIRVGVFTNLTQDHLDFFGTMENYARVKADFFMGDQVQVAVINADDAVGQDIIKRRVWGLRPYFSGRNFTETNANACVEVAREMGVCERKIRRRLKNLPNVAGRFNVFKMKNGATVIVDYAHTPDGLDKILTAARAMVDVRIGNLIAVFGCGGNRDTTKRPIMGQIASEKSDYIVITSDNPRNEPPADIMREIEAGVKGVPYRMIEDRAQATRFAIDMARAGDVVVIAGKGAEVTQEIAGVFYPYSDLEIVAKYIVRRRR